MRSARVAFLAAAMSLSLAVFAGAPGAARADGTPPAPAQSSSPSTTPLTPEQQRIENVIAAARQYVGVPYRVGTEGPATFDCSGLVFRAFSDAGLVDRIGGERLRAAGYMRLFAAKGLMTTDETQALRGDLVVYGGGAHIGIYLGDGRVISALLTGVTVHSLNGISLPVTGFLRPDWSGDGEVAPFQPIATLPDVPEAPATLVPASSWMPTLSPALSAPVSRGGKEVTDLRTPNSRTFQNADGTFTTEFHAQPIFFQPQGTSSPAQLAPIDLSFAAGSSTSYATVTKSPVAVTARPANDASGFLTASSSGYSISLALPSANGSSSTPQLTEDGRVVDFFGFQPQQVGLRVLAQTDGFKTFLVMSRQPDQTKYSFVLNAPGIVPTMVSDGSIELADQSGNIVGRISRPLLLDSSDDDGSGGGLFTAAASLSLNMSGPLPVITVSIDSGKLAEAVYPAYVDLSLTNFPQLTAGADVTFTSSLHPNVSLHGFQRPESAGFDEVWLGHQKDSTNNNEVFVRFAGLASTLGTVDVANASLEMLPYFARANDGQVVAHAVTSDWNADTLDWAAMPATDSANLGNLSGSAGSWATLDVSTYVTNILSHGQADYGLELQADRSSAGTWERLAASDAGEQAEFGPRLVVTWSGLRPTALAATSTGKSPAGNPHPLSWGNPAIAPVQVRYEGQVSVDSFATIVVDHDSGKGVAGATDTWMVPAGELRDGGAYEWRVRVKYGSDRTWSPWSAPQNLVVSAPSLPHGALPL